MSKKWLISLALIALITLATACGGNDSEANQDEADTQDEQTQEVQEEMPEPNLEDIPDVVAEVNGTEIGKEDFTATYQTNFQQMAMQSQMSGEEVDEAQLKEQTVDMLIDQKLLEQEANNSDYDVSEQETNDTLEEIASQNGLQSTDELLSALKEQGMEEDDVLSQVELQVKLDQIVAERAGDVKPSEEEIKAAYDQAIGQQEQTDENTETPPLDEVRSDIEKQLTAQKENEVLLTIVDELRQKADITIHL